MFANMTAKDAAIAEPSFLNLKRGHLNKGMLELFLSLPKGAHSCINFLRLTRLSVRCLQAHLVQVVKQSKQLGRGSLQVFLDAIVLSYLDCSSHLFNVIFSGKTGKLGSGNSSELC